MLQYVMKMLFYIGLSGNLAESSLATIRYLPENIRFAGDGCDTRLCVSKILQVSKMQQSDAAPKAEALRKVALELRRVS